MSDQAVSNMHPNTCASADDAIHPLDILFILAQRKKLVLGLPLVCGALALGISMIMTPLFTSTAKIMPPQQQQSSSVAAMLGQFGGLAGGAGGIANIKTPNDLYVGLLESRTVADNLIARFKLKERYESKTMDGARRALSGVSEISSGKKDGLLSISTTDRDPQFAADLANAYVEELAKLTQVMALSEASQRRRFFEAQLKDARDQLANAEVALRTTQEKTGMIQPDAQVQAIIGNAAQLKGTIAAKEVQLNAMRTFAARQNPELLRTQEELRGLTAQLAKLESKQQGSDGDFMVPTRTIPAVGVQYVRSIRNVKYYETVFELLAKQFELAKIDEAKESSLIQVLDKAVAAEHKSKPRRLLFALSGLIVGGLLGLVLAVGEAIYKAVRSNPLNRLRWARLTQARKDMR